MSLRLRCLFLLLSASGFTALVDNLAAAPTIDSFFSQNKRPEWQWSVPVESVISTETNGHPRAFLWIPPNCKRLRGVVIGQNNMEEEQIFESSVFRHTLEQLDFALVWVTPPFNIYFRFDQGAGEQLDELLADLGAESGYGELSTVPLVPLGHSAAAMFPWQVAFRTPDRVLAAISVSGQWAYFSDDKNVPKWPNRTLDGVPGLVTMGEYENAWQRAGTGLTERTEHPKLPLTMLAEPAGEHFAATDRKIAFISCYIRKAAEHRLPKDWPIQERPKLKEIDPTKDGWLVSRGREDGKPLAPAAQVGKYTGDPKDAFWAFDGELAREIESIGAQHAGKKLQLLAYVQKGEIVQQRNSHVRVGLKVMIENNDLTFQLSSAFLDTAPVDWRGLKAGDPISHARDASKLAITRICGPIEKIGPETYALRFYRGGLDNPKRSGSASVILSHPGDEIHKPMALEAEMKFWLKNQEGKEQRITFDQPPGVRYGTRLIELTAKSDGELPVFFYVREGPAIIEGNTLHFTQVPPRAKFPMKATVVAWQWGRMSDPKIQSAEPVERTILINR